MNISKSLRRFAVLSLLLLPFGPGAAGAGAGADSQARDLVQASMDAYGGLANWRGKGALVVQETQTRYESGATQEIRLVHYLDTANRGYRLERTDASGTQVFGWDGREFWATADGRPGDDDLRAEARRVILDAWFRFSLPFALAEAAGEYAGTDVVDGVKTEVVRFEFKGNPADPYFKTAAAGHDMHKAAEHGQGGHGSGHHDGPQIYYFHFDPSHRLVKVYFSHHGDGTYETLLMKDYRDVGGVPREQARVVLLPDGQRLYESALTRIEFRRDVDPGLYRRPPA